jgi:hypothetical protein
VSDAGLAHFKGMPLTVLWIHNTGITDLTPLQGMPLEDIRLTPKNVTKGLKIDFSCGQAGPFCTYTRRAQSIAAGSSDPVEAGPSGLSSSFVQGGERCC